MNVLGGTRRPRPVIPGWEIEGVLGEGGLGLVWRATRLSDGVPAAVKVPRLAEIDHIERLEQEAGTLRSLVHPHIVRLLDSGPLDDGGMFLAMEFIEGSTLSHALPTAGFAPERAFEIFHQIAGAVAYAHERGIIHRDLKPANVLLDGEGSAHVADFDLARPVHERVQHLSLTHSGHVAGTAEYLPPEAYRAGFIPGVKGDIYALGIILHELLIGSPPRGAWRAVSDQRHVDIRVDEVLSRALDPDPGARWSSVAEMAGALAEIDRSPPRYSGTPLVSPGVRALDAAWTFLGLMIHVAALGVILRIAQARIPWPIDLIGAHSPGTGSFQALFFLLLAMVPLALWQVARLRRFRGVPLREALPAPFGARLGHSRATAAGIVAAQLVCFLGPLLLLASIWRFSVSQWLKPGDPAWVRGLAVVGRGDGKWIDPWSWPNAPQPHWLSERSGVPGDPIGRQIDVIEFIPGVLPWIMTACAVCLALALFYTAGAAARRWTHRRRPVRLAILAGATVALIAATISVHASLVRSWNKLPVVETPAVRANHTTILDELNIALFASEPATWQTPPESVLAGYAPAVEFRGQGRIPREQIGPLLAAQAATDRLCHRRLFCFRDKIFPMPDWRFDAKRSYVEFMDHPDGSCAISLLDVLRQGELPRAGGAFIDGEILQHQILYATRARELPQADAEGWTRGFFAALSESTALEDFLVPQMLLLNENHNQSDKQSGLRNRELIVAPFESSGRQLTLAGPPSASTPQPGGRRRITFPVRDPVRGQTFIWTADLIFLSGRWQAVQLIF
ncbi:MAG: serine/threonine-protein kinase [Chthoniobacteraceae bacterium]